MLKKLSFFFLVLGLTLIAAIVWPILQFKVWELSEYKNNQSLVSPSTNVLGISALGDFNSGKFGESTLPKPYAEFKISVPKLKLVEEKVLVYSNNFDKNLAQLPRTALPGEKGNVFITGHSSAFIWDLNNKKPILNNLNLLKNNDEIKVEALGQIFEYIVENVKIVSPKDVYVINPPESEGRYLTLMTCVPPGLNSQRLVVLAKMDDR